MATNGMVERSYWNSLEFNDEESGMRFNVTLSQSEIDRAQTDPDFARTIFDHYKALQAQTGTDGNWTLQQQAENEDEGTEGSSSSQSSSVTWEHRQVLCLLEAYRANRRMLCDPTKKKVEVWKVIGACMASNGFHCTGDQCLRKWDNMKSRFKIISDRNKKTGNGRSSWAYYDLMADLLRGDPAIQPPVTVSSLHGVEEPDQSPAEDSEPSPTRSPSCPATPAVTDTRSRSATTDSGSKNGTSGAKKGKFRDRRNEPPQWFRECHERQVSAMDRVASALEEKNAIFKQLLDRFLPNNSGQ